SAGTVLPMYAPCNGTPSSIRPAILRSSTTRRCWTISCATHARRSRSPNPLFDPESLMKIVNPATGAMLAEVAVDGHAAVRRKYELARAAQPRWGALPLKKRLDTIRAFREQ